MEEEDLKAELTCPICMDLFCEPRRLPCGHVYCRVCLQDMLTRKYLNTRASERILSCPECRQRYDLTFQEAGVDVFTRDFKLYRLVELFQKKFSRGSDDQGGEGGAEAGADDQTAVKAVHSGERENSPQNTSTTEIPAAAASSSSLNHVTSLRRLSSQQSSDLAFPFGSGIGSLSDDSWIYVSPDGRYTSVEPVVPPVRGGLEQGSDSWLLPSGPSDLRPFPVDGRRNLRESACAPEVNYRTLHSVPVSGCYDNSGPETFQRFALEEPTVQVVRLPSRPAQAAPSSQSSSESESSDERGEDVSDDRSGASRSGSEADSQGRHRRSRLSRFFRSLVMSDSDSYDDDDLPLHSGQGSRDAQQFHGDYYRGTHSSMSVGGVRMGERDSEGVPGPVMAETGSLHNGMVSEISHGDGGRRLPAPRDLEGREMVDRDKIVRCDSNHNDMRGSHAETVVRSADVATAAAAPSGVTGGVGRAVVATGRGRSAIEASDESDEDYEPQTSMLRPRRKPRSRLKKFFTSLLSLSSSDDEEDIDGQVAPTPSTSSENRP